MKKNNENYSLNSDFKTENNFFTDQFKTTNINVLLNRVKIEKKNDFKKKIYLTLVMFLVIGLVLTIVVSI